MSWRKSVRSKINRQRSTRKANAYNKKIIESNKEEFIKDGGYNPNLKF